MNKALQDDFRYAMRRLASTVSLLTCARGGMRYGIAATTVTSLAVEPPSVLTCINTASSVIRPLEEEGRFCVNVLSKRHVDVVKAFSHGADRSRRFESGEWRQTECGIPYLADAQANIFCLVDDVYGYATHRIVIGKVTSVKAMNCVAPLLYQDGAYAASIPMSPATG